MLGALIYAFGYASTVTLLLLMPLFVYSIYSYPKHPLTRRARTPRDRFKYMILFGSLRFAIGTLLAGTFVELANQYPRVGSETLSAAIVAAAEFLMAVITLYVSIYIPVVEVRKEGLERANHLVRKRYEHRKYYVEYSREKRNFMKIEA